MRYSRFQSVAVQQSVPSGLLPGEERSFTVTTPPGGNCFGPDCTIPVEVDSGRAVKECNEGNNKQSETTPGWQPDRPFGDARGEPRPASGGAAGRSRSVSPG